MPNNKSKRALYNKYPPNVRNFVPGIADTELYEILTDSTKSAFYMYFHIEISALSANRSFLLKGIPQRVSVSSNSPLTQNEIPFEATVSQHTNRTEWNLKALYNMPVLNEHP